MKSIEITIAKDGSLTVHSQGFQGKSCLAELEKFLAKLKSLGLDTTQISQQLTPEAFQQERSSIRQTV